MPLHDGTALSDWESVHQLWIVELYRWIKPRLPAGYRAGLGTVPALTVGTPSLHPDVIVRRASPSSGNETGASAGPAAGDPEPWRPDVEVAVLALDPNTVVQVTRQGQLIAVVEVVSPRNKDRPEARIAAQNRYLGYLTHRVHLLLIDLHPQPYGFSFADGLAAALGLEQPPCPAPLVVSDRVGDPAPAGGRMLGFSPRQLTIGAPLPTVPLPLTLDCTVLIDLERTYTRATADAYPT